MPIQSFTFSTKLDQMIWVVKSIKDLIEIQNVDPKDVVVIARKHQQLMDLVPIFEYFQVEISYERGQNVLRKKEIVELVTILKFIDSIDRSDTQVMEELLPEILCYEFWQLPPSDIYELSQFAYRNRKTWLDSMQEMDKPNLKLVADFLVTLGSKSKSAYLEQVIDEITGISKQAYTTNSTDEEYDKSITDYKYDPNKGIINTISEYLTESHAITKYISPYKWYYFDRHYSKHSSSNFESGNSSYLSFLSALKVFIDNARNFTINRDKTNSVGDYLKVADVVRYVDLLNKRNIRLIDNNLYNSSNLAVSLITAHKAKGLEFEYVYIIDCVEESWNGRGGVNKVGLPSNLALLPQAENIDDSIRLFFVALTRAKTFLNLTNYKYNLEGKEVQPLSFLSGLVDFKEVESSDFNIVNPLRKALSDTLTSSTSNPLSIPLNDENRQNTSPLTIWFESVLRESEPNYNLANFLKPQLENYKLSVTHLNNFLDLARGGPSFFLEKNLLGFPQGKNPNAGYGSAMHLALNEFYKEFKRTEVLPTLDFLLLKFKISLLDQRLSTLDQEKFLEKGVANLKTYYQNRQNNFNLTDRTEEDFKSQNVVIGQAKITGKIDKMIIDHEAKQIEVVDLKTGKAHTKWSGSTLETTIKLTNYHRQLVFYKLLVEQSRDFNQFTVQRGSLDFLDVAHNESKNVVLEAEISKQEAIDLAKLVQVVYFKIVDLANGKPLPDVSQFSPDMNGINMFIKSLIEEFDNLSI